MSNLWLLFDGLLALATLALATALLFAPDLRRAVMLFIPFGLVVALIWARLRAPDLALAEAAIGAGLTGAMLLNALSERERYRGRAAAHSNRFQPVWLLSAIPLALLAALLAWALLPTLAGESERLAESVAIALPQTGVENPVTAVLLNLRAYDTLLELAVLLVAVLGIRALGTVRMTTPNPGALFNALVAWLVPLLILVSGYLLWVGAYRPGGAFQAGALLAGAGILLHLAGDPRAGLPNAAALRGLLAAGVATFLAIGVATLLFAGGFLDYPQSWAGDLILIIESAATLAIAATLVAAYLGGECDESGPFRCNPNPDETNR